MFFPKDKPQNMMKQTKIWAFCGVKTLIFHHKSWTILCIFTLRRYFIFHASQGVLHPRLNLPSAVLTMTMRDHFHPPLSDCVRVTTRGQKPALILYSL